MNVFDANYVSTLRPVNPYFTEGNRRAIELEKFGRRIGDGEDGSLFRTHMIGGLAVAVTDLTGFKQHRYTQHPYENAPDYTRHIRERVGSFVDLGRPVVDELRDNLEEAPYMEFMKDWIRVLETGETTSKRLFGRVVLGFCSRTNQYPEYIKTEFFGTNDIVREPQLISSTVLDGVQARDVMDAVEDDIFFIASNFPDQEAARKSLARRAL